MEMVVFDGDNGSENSSQHFSGAVDRDWKRSPFFFFLGLLPRWEKLPLWFLVSIMDPGGKESLGDRIYPWKVVF